VANGSGAVNKGGGGGEAAPSPLLARPFALRYGAASRSS